MKKNQYFVVLFFFTFFSHSQNNLTIKDKETKKTIPFVLVNEYKTDTFLVSQYSDENGVFSFEKSLDSLTIKHPFYEDLKIKLDTFKGVEIFLTPKIQEIEEIKITNKTQNIGLNSVKKKINLSYSSGLETCLFIENVNKKETRIKGILIKLIKKSKDKETFRINFYKKSITKFEPGNQIKNSSITITLDKKISGEYKVNTQELDIVMPEDGVFVSFELIGFHEKNKDLDKNLKLEINDAINSKYTFGRNLLRNTNWVVEDKYFFKDLGVVFKNQPNLSIGLTVYE